MKATPKDNIIYFPKKKYTSSYKKRNKVKPYIKTDDDWFEITRANDASKKLSEKAVKLCSKLEYELHKSNDRPVFLSPYWFEKITRNARHQNARLRSQISHIFNFTFHAKIVHEDVFYSNVYEVSHTLESNKILNLEDVIIEKIKPSKPQKPKLHSSSKNALGVEHKSDTYIIEDKEKEEEALAYSSSFSNNEKLKIKSFSEQLSQEENIEERTLAASPFEGLAKVQQKEEIRRETSFSPSQSADEEKEHLRSHGKRESLAEEPIPLASLPIFAKFCNLPISEEKEETQTVIIEKIEENAELGYNSQEPDNPNQNCEMETDINSLIFKAFGHETGKQLIENCEIKLIEPDKVGIKIQGITITNYEKEQLRDCIRTAYGENTKIILLNKLEEKPRVNKDTDVQPAVETPERFNPDNYKGPYPMPKSSESVKRRHEHYYTNLNDSRLF